MPEARRIVTIGSAVGLHARPASLFVTAATESAHDVRVTTESGQTADARSILMVLALGIPHGAVVHLDVVGEDADAVADRLAALLASDLDA